MRPLRSTTCTCAARRLSGLLDWLTMVPNSICPPSTGPERGWPFQPRTSVPPQPALPAATARATATAQTERPDMPAGTHVPARTCARTSVTQEQGSYLTDVRAPRGSGARALGRTRLVAEHQLALDRARLGARRRAPAPDVVGPQVPGVRVVGERALERVEQ